MNKDAAARQEFTERKRALLRDGERYRVGIARARVHVEQGLRPEAMLRGALAHAGSILRSRIHALTMPAGLGAPALLPLLLGGLGQARRRGLLKPAVGLVLALGLAGAAAWYMRRQAPWPEQP